MEKVIYLLIAPAGAPAAASALALTTETAPALLRNGAHEVQVNVTDPSLGHPFGVDEDDENDRILAAVSVWVDSAEAVKVASFLPVAPTGATWYGYVVCESEPRPNRTQPPRPDGRVPGFSQVVALPRPDSVGWGEWRRIWQGSHPAVALNTQAPFRSVQNLVFRPLTAGAPPFAGIGEECFPSEAAHDLHAYFASGGDDARLARHMAAMAESCDRFMDGSAPLAWTTEWVFRAGA